MEILRMPSALENKGITGWPKIVLVGANEPAPTNGLPFIRATRQDYVLTFRVLMPALMLKYPRFNWDNIFYELTGRKYIPVKTEICIPNSPTVSDLGYAPNNISEETKTLEELASNMSSHVDLNILRELHMIPAFFEDIAEAIKVNITNSYQWHDGYNKKTRMCTGYLEEQQRKKSLVILDISSSIPDGLSASMMVLIQTITEVTHADLIITGGSSYFYTNEEVRTMDIHKERKRIPRSNESEMFLEILDTHDMNYEVVIAFGDSDAPLRFRDYSKLLTKEKKVDSAKHVKKLYSFFIGERDTYGNHYSTVAGYARWVLESSPNVEVIHNYKWAHLFHK